MIKVTGNIYVLENSFFRRKIQFDNGGLRTTELFNKATGRALSREISGSEFMLRLNSKILHGNSSAGEHVLDGNIVESQVGLRLVEAKIEMDGEWHVLKVFMHAANGTLLLSSCYAIHPRFPAMRKWLELNAVEQLTLGDIYIECLHAYPGELKDVDIFRSDAPGLPYTYFSAKSDVDSVQLHNSVENEGYFLSSNIPGPLRHFLVYPHWAETSLSVGYNKELPNTVYLDKGEVFTTHEAYLYLYTGMPDDEVVANEYRDFIRDRLPSLPNNEGVMYCTWIPFLKNINEKLIYSLVDKASELGFLYFVIDDGWFVEPGWTVDPEKFPNGLKPISDYIHAKGMKFGLWFNIGTDYGDTNARPMNNRKNIDGVDDGLGFSGTRVVQCMASGHRDVIADKLIELAERYGVDYYKMDFSSIVSPYGILAPGCHSNDHEHHKNFADSLIAEYASLAYVRSGVKKRLPDLVLDFSFEAFGTEIPGVAALQYSDLHHVSNMNTNHPDKCSAMMIRNNFYKFAEFLPVERILGGLICLQGQDADVVFENLATSFMLSPLVAGNLLELPDEAVAVLKSVQNLTSPLFAKGALTNFIRIDDEPRVIDDRMDGFARYNPEGWGIICMFTNGANERSINVAIRDIPQGNYLLKNTRGDIFELDGLELRDGTIFKCEGHCEMFSFEKI